MWRNRPGRSPLKRRRIVFGEKTRGFDPLFRTNDASNCEGAAVSTLAERRDAFSLILKRGLIRVGLDVPTQTNDVPPKPAEFEIVAVDDPYHCLASAQACRFRSARSIAGRCRRRNFRF